MNIETFETIVNLAPWVFVAIIAIFALVGMIKGVWKTFTGMIIQALILVIVTLITPSIANLLGNMDLTKYISQSTVVFGNTEIHVSSVRMMVCEYITSTGMVSPVSGQSIYEAAMSLTNVILSFVVFVALAIVLGLFGWLLSILIYHTIVKWFISRKKRLKYKHRAMGLVTGAAMGFFSAWLMITPFSYLAHTVRENQEALTTAKKSVDDDMDEYIDYALVVGNSTFGSDWLYGASSFIVNTATTNGYLGSDANMSSLTSLISGLSTPVSKGLSTDENTAFDYTLIVGDKAAVNTMLDVLIGSNVVIKVMPSILQAAIGYVNMPESIDLSKLDFSDMDFSTELSMIKSVYGSLYDAGLITAIMNEESFTIDEENKENYLTALKTLGSDGFVAKNLSVFVREAAEYLKDMSGFEMLSIEDDAYAIKSDENPNGIDWASELSNLGEIVFSLSDTLDIPLNQDGLAQLQDKFISGLQDETKFDDIKKVIVGTGDFEGKGLFDSFIFQDGIFDLGESIDYLFTYYPVLKEYMNQDEISDTFEQASWSQVKQELSYIIDLYPDVSDLYEIGKDESGTFNFDLNNTELLNKSKEIITSLKNLDLLKSIIPGVVYSSLPSILKNTFGSESVFGLNTYSFNFTDADVILDGAGDFLDVIPAINNLMDTMNNNDGGIKNLINSINTDDLKNILTTFIDSKMLNPDRIVDGKKVSDTNINTILTNLMGDFGLDSYGIELTNDTSSIIWNTTSDDGTKSYPEVDNLVAILDDLKTYGSVLGDDGSFSLDELDGSDLKVIMGDLTDSALFGDSVGPLMDKQVRPILDGLSIEISLNKKREEWRKVSGNGDKTTLDYLGDLFDLMKPFMNSSSLDYKNLSGDYINALLTTLINSSFLGDDYEDVLSSFMGGILDDTFQASEKLGYDASLICQTSGHTDGNTFVWIGTYSVPAEGFYLYRDASAEGQLNFKNIAIDDTGEISRICAAFETLMPMADNLTSGSFESDQMSDVLMALHSSTILKRLVPSVLRIAMDTAAQGLGDTLDLTLLDFESFIALDDAAFKNEVGQIVTIYNYSKDGTLGDIIDNINEITGDSLAKDEQGNYRSRKDVLQEILSDIDNMAVTTGVRKDKDHSLRTQMYSVIFSKAKISQTFGGSTIDITFSMLCFYTYDEFVDMATNFDATKYQQFKDDADSLMLSRILELDAKENSASLFDSDLEILMDLLVNKDSYISSGAGGDISGILGLEDSNLLVGSGEFMMSLVTIASIATN